MLNETFKYGIEIEFTGADLRTVADAINASGVDCRYEGYNHVTRSHWKLVTDATVSSGTFGGELVSPVLSGEAGLINLKRVLYALNSVEGVNVNHRCGVHVHLSWPNMTVDQMTNVAARYARYEDEIDLFMPLSRRGPRAGGGYCATVKGVNWTRIKERANDCGYQMGQMSPRNNKVNLQAYSRHKTIEFRHHSGTTEFDKIANWVRFVMAFTQKALDTTSAAPVSSASSRAYAALRSAVENAGGEMVYRGRRWMVTGDDGETTAYTIDELNELHVGSLTATRWQDWRSADWRLIDTRFAAFFARHFPGSANTHDTLFAGMTDDVVAFYTARKDALS